MVFIKNLMNFLIPKVYLKKIKQVDISYLTDIKFFEFAFSPTFFRESVVRIELGDDIIEASNYFKKLIKKLSDVELKLKIDLYNNKNVIIVSWAANKIFDILVQYPNHTHKNFNSLKELDNFLKSIE